MIFGLKKVPVRIIPLLNNDEKKPISMIGQKMVPILEYAPKKFMPESLDIIRHIDQQSPPTIVSWKSHPALTLWLEESASIIYTLAMPRWVQAPLKEFQTKKARDYFQRKKEKMIGPFAAALEQTKELKVEINKQLTKLNKMLNEQSEFFTDQLSVNDFHLFTALRSLTIVKDIRWPKKVQYYLHKLSTNSQVPLHNSLAI